MKKLNSPVYVYLKSNTNICVLKYYFDEMILSIVCWIEDQVTVDSRSTTVQDLSTLFLIKDKQTQPGQCIEMTVAAFRVTLTNKLVRYLISH